VVESRTGQAASPHRAGKPIRLGLQGLQHPPQRLPGDSAPTINAEEPTSWPSSADYPATTAVNITSACGD
jgi:hypothetical protein